MKFIKKEYNIYLISTNRYALTERTVNKMNVDKSAFQLYLNAQNQKGMLTVYVSSNTCKSQIVNIIHQ